MINSYVEFTAFGVYCGEFIDFLVSSDYQVSDITSSNDIYTIKTSPKNYPAIAKLAREYRVKTRVVARSGAYFELRRYRKRVGILFGVIAFFGIIVLMSNFVWNIKISGSDKVGNWQIFEQLAQSGIRPGVHIDGFNANQAELELGLSIPELAWVSIERSGSRINVKVSERLEEESEEIPLDTPCDVIANRSGQLIKAEVYRGQLLFEVTSGINKGDVIVSGKVKDAAGRRSRVHADAKLFIEAIEVADFYQPYMTLHRAKNGRSKNNKSVVFLGRRFGGELEVPRDADHVDYFETLKVPDFFGFPLPFQVLNQNYVFYDRVEVTDSATIAREKLDRQIELYEVNFLSDAEILEKEVEYFPGDDGIGVLVKYVFHIDAAEKRELVN